jgi:hypothetical protein
VTDAGPNVYRASYTRADAAGQSAARLVRYLTRRPADKERPGRESQWHSIPEEHTFGDAEAFKREANRRRRERLERHDRQGSDIGQDHSPRNVAYEHVVLSPRGREWYRPEDFESLIGPWVRDRRGRPCAYFAAIHFDDPEGPKLHLAVARDRIHRTKELPSIRARTDELVRERQMLRELERCPERARQRERQHEHVAEREEERMAHDRHRQGPPREVEEPRQRHREEEARREKDLREEAKLRRVTERRRERLEREAREREDDEYEREV